jgi:hypothetical protein
MASALLSLFAGTAFGEELSKVKGRILGEKCAEKARIGECYLAWAEPMVFWTDEGDYYRIDLAGGGLKQERLDEAFGLEVEAWGRIVKQEQGERVQFSQLNILKPPGSREFFKG